MSSIHTASVLLLFLFLHSCNSRRISSLLNDVSITDFGSQSPFKGQREMDPVREETDRNGFPGSIAQESVREEMGIAQTKRLVRVSWRGAQATKRDGHQPPLFYADYPKPNPRPPRHN